MPMMLIHLKSIKKPIFAKPHQRNRYLKHTYVKRKQTIISELISLLVVVAMLPFV